MESILSEHDGAGNGTPMDFDTLFDTKALRIMRVLIPFFPASYQPLLAVWVRFAQLRYALSLINDRRFRTGMTGAARSSAQEEPSLTRLLSALKPCLSESEYQELVRMQNMFSMYQRFQKLMPYLSALNGMSGDLSAADMMNAFSAMQGDSSSAADLMSAFSAMQGDSSSATDLMSAFSAMQGDNSSAADLMSAFSAMQGGNTPPSDTRSDMNAASVAQDETISQTAAEHANTDDTDSSGSQSTGSGMDMNRILDLISLFQASSDETNAAPNISERQDEQNHE